VTNASHALNDRLRYAIANKHLIEICYHGSVRVAEPHDYGVHKGIERLLIFQLRDSVHAHNHSATGWRLLDTSQIEECLVLEKNFPGSRGLLHQSHLVWDVVYARVS
jgi:hypothetical protein